MRPDVDAIRDGCLAEGKLEAARSVVQPSEAIASLFQVAAQVTHEEALAAPRATHRDYDGDGHVLHAVEGVLKDRRQFSVRRIPTDDVTSDQSEIPFKY